MLFSEAVLRAAQQLETADLCYGQGYEDADDEALRIVYAGAGIDPQSDIAKHRAPPKLDLDCQAVSIIEGIVKQRISSRRPLAYILGEAWFCGQRFYIDERAIVPRSYFAEWIPDQFQPWVNPEQVNTILDLCCGSGCIAICCALAFPNALVQASDISSNALQVATRNIADYGLQDQVAVNQGSMFDGIQGRFDLIVCNPPYVAKEQVSVLPPEYAQEPEVAFSAGVDGLDFVLKLLVEACRYLTPLGIIIIESGSASEKLEELLCNISFVWLSTEFDEKALFLLEANQLEAVRKTILKTQSGAWQ